MLTDGKKFIKRKPVLCSLLLSVCAAFIFRMSDGAASTGEFIFSVLLIGLCFIYPLILTLINLIALFYIPKDPIWRKNLKRFEYITLILGVIDSCLVSEFLEVGWNIVMDAKWNEVLQNSQKHQPVWTGAAPTVFVLCAIGVMGYLVLKFFRLEKLPPLVIVLSISAMYIGVLQCILWCIQIGNLNNGILCLFPLNCIMIAMKTIRYKIIEWREMEKQHAVRDREGTILQMFQNKLANALYWPIFALVMMLPLLGVVLCILVLFGQRPDYVIKAWTETADWRLSEQIAPPNVFVDEHYLCTVAAGGHAGIVKPLRMGERHGHRVVVNRQLCIANAFEQILEERVPRFHRLVRNVYDTCGLPVARLIRTKFAADIVYICMKSLEWMFLIVIYLCDAKPENRIAVQYLPRRQ